MSFNEVITMDKVNKISNQYQAQDKAPNLDKYQELVALDKKAKRPAKIFGYTFGTISSLVLGTGMCFAMKVIGASISAMMPIGIGIGVLGILGVSLNYAFYKKLLKKGKNKYSKRILELSNELENENN